MKVALKSKMRWIALVGLFLSAASLFSHFLLAMNSGNSLVGYRPLLRIFTWRPSFQIAVPPRTSSLYKKLWGPMRSFQHLHPYARPRGNYPAPHPRTNGFVFVKIQGGFHDIRNSICDAVVICRLLNATLVIPELQSTTSSKGISSGFKSFSYIYDEDHFIEALTKDVVVVKGLPKNFKVARKKKEIPTFKVSYSTSPIFYLKSVFPALKLHSVVELLASDGGCLQAVLPSHLDEYQRLRCRVAFHALHFRKDVQEIASRVVNRLQAFGRPFLAFHPGITKDSLAYHGCAELFQDVHTELIQHKRLWMIKRGLIKGDLSVDSVKLHLNGSCPILPKEVGILLRAYGYSPDTIIYISGGEIFGGQRLLIPLHGLFENVVDRASLTTVRELARIYGWEKPLVDTRHFSPPSIDQEREIQEWKTSGPRPRPLPPPPSRPKYPYNVEGWWGWVTEIDKEPEKTTMELRIEAHKLLWEAIDYHVCIQANSFIPGFDRDEKGRPNFASMVMGHRLYQSPSLKTFRPDRKQATELLHEIRDHLYQANQVWLTSVARFLSLSTFDGLVDALNLKFFSFLSHPLPECMCSDNLPLSMSNNSSNLSKQLHLEFVKVDYQCPPWMKNGTEMQLNIDEDEEDLGDVKNLSSNQLFVQSNRHEVGSEVSNKEEVQTDDQEDVDGSEV